MRPSVTRFVNSLIAFVVGLGLTSWALLASQEEEIQFQAEHQTWYKTQNDVRLLLEHQADVSDFIKSQKPDAYGWLDLHFGPFNPHGSDGVSYHFPTNNPNTIIHVARGDLLASSKTNSLERRLMLIPSNDGRQVLVRGILSGDTVFRGTLPLPR